MLQSMLIEFRNEAGKRRGFASFCVMRWPRGEFALPGLVCGSWAAKETEPLKPFAVRHLDDATGRRLEVSTTEEFGRPTVVLEWPDEDARLFLRVDSDGTLTEFRDPLIRGDRPQICIRFCSDGSARVVPGGEPNGAAICSQPRS